MQVQGSEDQDPLSAGGSAGVSAGSGRPAYGAVCRVSVSGVLSTAAGTTAGAGAGRMVAAPPQRAPDAPQEQRHHRHHCGVSGHGGVSGARGWAVRQRSGSGAGTRPPSGSTAGSGGSNSDSGPRWGSGCGRRWWCRRCAWRCGQRWEQQHARGDCNGRGHWGQRRSQRPWLMRLLWTA